MRDNASGVTGEDEESDDACSPSDTKPEEEETT
jgi:hypothetical protein